MGHSDLILGEAMGSANTFEHNCSVEAPFLSARPLVAAYISLLLFMFVYFARPEDWVPGLAAVPLAKMSGFLALTALVLSIWSVHRRLPREVIYLMFLTGQLFVAALLSPIWRGGAFLQAFEFAKALLIVIVIAMSVRTLTRLHLLIFVHALSVAAIAVVTICRGHLLAGERLEGVLGANYADPNDLALTIIISLPLCLALLFLSRHFLSKCFWAVSMIIMVYAVVLTGSRGGFVTLVCTAAFCLWRFRTRLRLHFVIFAVVLVSVTLWQPSVKLLSQRLRGTFGADKGAGEAYESSQTRERLFWRSVAVTFEHPLFGVGPGNFQQLSGSWNATHNSFTQMSSEGGLLALILYLLILCTGFRNLKRVERYGLARRKSRLRLLAAALQATLIAYIVGSSFLTVAYYSFPYFLVAYTTALVAIAKASSLGVKRESAPQGQISNCPLTIVMDDVRQY